MATAQWRSGSVTKWLLRLVGAWGALLTGDLLAGAIWNDHDSYGNYRYWLLWTIGAFLLYVSILALATQLSRAAARRWLMAFFTIVSLAAIFFSGSMGVLVLLGPASLVLAGLAIRG